MNTLKLGDRGQMVVRLQEFLNLNGYGISMDGVFGPGTERALKDLQKTQGTAVCVIADGIARQEMIDQILACAPKLDLWCNAIKSVEGYFAPGESSRNPRGTASWRNNNPGNLEYHRQIGTKGSDGRFAIFRTYQDGYNALKSLLIRAATGQMPAYRANGSLADFYAVYAPSGDDNDPMAYAQTVAKAIGVSVETKIKDLIN